MTKQHRIAQFTVSVQNDINAAEAKPRFDAIRREAQNRKSIAIALNRAFGG